MQSQIVCNCCNQPITEKSALKAEKKRLADLAKAKAEDKAIDKACDAAYNKIIAAIKRVNFERKPFIELKLEECTQGESIKAPIDFLSLKVYITGEEIDGELSFDGYRDIVRFFQKLGSPLL